MDSFLNGNRTAAPAVASRFLVAGRAPGVPRPGRRHLGGGRSRRSGRADGASGAFEVEPVAPSDWLRIAELVSRYRDLPLGTVAAPVVAPAERLGVAEVATLDRRHLVVVRPAHVDAFTLLP